MDRDARRTVAQHVRQPFRALTAESLIAFLTSRHRRLPLDRCRCRSLAAVVVVSLAIGIGVNTVVFSWIQARMLKPLPGVADGAAAAPRRAEDRSRALCRARRGSEFKDLRDSLQFVRGPLAARMAPLYVGDQPAAVERLFGLLVSDNYFSALGVQPALGRFFRAATKSQHAGGAPVAVISHRLWQSRFQRRGRRHLARTIRINGRELTVIGVTPDEFQGTTVGLQFDAWLPATLAPVVRPDRARSRTAAVRGYAVMGRLHAGVARRQAQAELDACMRSSASAYPATNAKVARRGAPLLPSRRAGRSGCSTPRWRSCRGSCCSLLLAVCGNVANLMLARASARQKEMGVRLALGARPWRIASLLLTENVAAGGGGRRCSAQRSPCGARRACSSCRSPGCRSDFKPASTRPGWRSRWRSASACGAAGRRRAGDAAGPRRSAAGVPRRR